MAQLELTADEARALTRLGQSLASTSLRPGFEEIDDASDRSVIRCTRTDREGVYNVRVSDAVGVVGVLDELQIEVQPKIPLSHLIYLMMAAEELPRLDEQDARVDFGDNLLELIARWYVKAAERLLRRGLIKDYSARQEFLAAKRGRLDSLRTGRSFYSARVGFECEFDEFDTDTPLNRVVREGASVVVRNPSLSPEIRREALRIRNRMDGISTMRFGDLRAEMDRRARDYTSALPLAKQLIQAEGRSLRSGARDTWSFLVRTPEMVEAGIRNVLSEGLAPRWTVKKGYVAAEGARVGFNPDLEFACGLAVGDVKYKLHGLDWNRGDLNQIVAFVAAYDCRDGAVFSFREVERGPLPTLGVGQQRIRAITWPVAKEITADEAAMQMIGSARDWLSSLSPAAEAVA